MLSIKGTTLSPSPLALIPAEYDTEGLNENVGSQAQKLLF
jgi:hypothetical protein